MAAIFYYEHNNIQLTVSRFFLPPFQTKIQCVKSNGLKF